MFSRARIQLTVIYCVFFFLLIWLASLLFYLAMDQTIGGDALISHFKQQEQQGQHEATIDEQSVLLAGEVTLDQLRTGLLGLNGGLLLTFPLVVWMLTGRTLKPVQLAHSQQAQFTATVAHELRTPLSILRGEIEVTLRSERSLDVYRQTLQSIQEEVEQLHELVEQLLSLARLEQRPSLEVAETVDLTDLLNQVVSVCEQRRRRRHLTILVHLAEESIVVRGQEALLRQAILNLLDNALKYTPAGGTISLELRRSHQSGLLIISDTGTGIADEDQKHLFERFYRGATARSLSQGYGLGLALVHEIVRLHRGQIIVHSRQGVGTTVVLMLPCS
ncbi:sensor histidine kinase [Thermogemmatispora tikiterensis]|uniref:histidine kinase n=1 Tax=Thermogemmatispora tikiterensis TaxID=1825093 RepID=A0A328VEU8_9CHLR|nr:ATP-binding protein [Thermogemmatispora tikiterensis]RAQ94063.1 hypothetical protein A4R35_00865 [Thermogemmatispora tikiterensis]